MKLITRKLAEAISKEVGFFNGWSVSDDVEWRACVKAAQKVIRIISRHNKTKIAKRAKRK